MIPITHKVANQKPVEGVSALLTRVEEKVRSNFFMIYERCIIDIFAQLPYRTGPQTSQTRVNVDQIKETLINISKAKFSLVISGLTRILKTVNDMVSNMSDSSLSI